MCLVSGLFIVFRKLIYNRDKVEVFRLVQNAHKLGLSEILQVDEYIETDRSTDQQTERFSSF